MTDLDDFNTVQQYAAWSFPCYRKFNCPKRHIIVNTETPEQNQNGGVITQGFSIGKKYALKIYDQFALNTSCFYNPSSAIS